MIMIDKKMTKNKIENGFFDFLEYLGVEIDENTEGTPKRIIKAWEEMCQGINQEEEIKKLLDVKFPAKYKGMITQGPLNFFSLCAHHLMPVEYRLYVGYIPTDKVVGFSKISKAIRLIATKPQNQEDFTQEVADNFMKFLDPEGFGMVVLGKHYCMHARNNGINHHSSSSITSIFKRSFRKSQSTREEFYKNIQITNYNSF